MAAPVATIAAKVAQKLAVDVLTNPEKGVKYVLYAIIGLIGLLVLFALPLILLVSIPFLLLNMFGGGSAPVDLQQQQIQLQTLAIYQKAPIIENQRALQWVEQKKTDYKTCDDIVVKFNFNLSWQSLMAIDAVRLGQDFSKSKEDDVLSLADKFLVTNSYTEKYQVEEEYQAEEEYEAEEKVKDPKTGKETTKKVKKKRTVTKKRTVEKTRAVISVSSKSFTDVLNSMGFTAEENEVALNMYNSMLSVDLEGNLNVYDDVDLSKLQEYPPGNANIPYFNQGDRRWGAEPYGSTGTIKSGGCGPTSLSMVVAGLTGRSDINPKVVADWSVANGHRAEGAGSYWSLMTAGGQHWGLNVQAVSRKDPKTIVEALSKGNPVIVSMGPGHFTSGGHFMVLRGIDKDGNILINDPASYNRTQVAWSLAVIMSESSTNGGENGSPFWIFTK